MKRCEKCGKRIWFWQYSSIQDMEGNSIDEAIKLNKPKGEKKHYHKECNPLKISEKCGLCGHHVKHHEDSGQATIFCSRCRNGVCN